MKSKLAKNLISLGVAIAAVFVIAFVTKPKLPAPENLSAAVLLGVAGESAFSIQFEPVYQKGGQTTFESSYRVQAKSSSRTLIMDVNMATGRVEKLSWNGRDVKDIQSIFGNAIVSLQSGQVSIQGKVPTLIAEILKSAQVSAFAIDPQTRQARSAAAKARVGNGGVVSGEVVR